MTKEVKLNLSRLHDEDEDTILKAFETDAKRWSDAIRVMNECRNRAHLIDKEMRSRSTLAEKANIDSASYPAAWDREKRLNRCYLESKRAYKFAKAIDEKSRAQGIEFLDMMPLLDILKGLADE